MNASPSPSSAKKRRIFLAAGEERFQILSVSQNPNDGSIYFSAPQFETIDWLVPAKGTDQTPILLSYKSDGPGKLTLHGSGITRAGPHEAISRHEFAIRGSALKRADGNSLGMRHLLTVLLPKPTQHPSSPAMARKTDYVLTTEELHPYVIIFWAVPAVRPLTVTITGSFQADELQEIPPNSGFGVFNLLLHSVVWFAYRTKHMEKWPRDAQACCFDGFMVPVLVGTAEGSARMELRQPSIVLQDSSLTVTI
jgi:hypothetical protein